MDWSLTIDGNVSVSHQTELNPNSTTVTGSRLFPTFRTEKRVRGERSRALVTRLFGEERRGGSGSERPGTRHLKIGLLWISTAVEGDPRLSCRCRLSQLSISKSREAFIKGYVTSL